MKIQFSRTVDYRPTFNGNRDLPEGEQIRVVFHVIETTDLMVLLDAFQSVGIKDVAPDAKPDALQSRKLIDLVPNMLPRYVEISGLQGDDDKELSIQDVSTFSTFLGLQTELLMQLSIVSQPTAQAAKNSNPPLGS